MARSHVLSKPVTGWEVGYEDRAESPTFYAHRRGKPHVIAAIDFDLLRDCSDKPAHHALDSAGGLVALRAAAQLRPPHVALTHVVRLLGIAPLVSVDIIDCSGGYACHKNSDPKLHRISTDFPIGVYVQQARLPAEEEDWGDAKAGRLNGWEHPSEKCPLHGGHDWIRASAWSSNRLQLESADSAFDREALRFTLVSLIEQVYGTRISTWTPSATHHRYVDGYSEEHDEREEHLQWEEADLFAGLRYASSCETHLGYALCSDLRGFVLPGEDRTDPDKRVWTHPNVVILQLQALATKHGCDIGDVRDIALWLDADRADHDPPRAAEHGPYDLCVDVAEAFGLDYDREELAQLRRLADGPDTF
jgi:hypothetical protein